MTEKIFPELDADEIYDAVRQGVYEAFMEFMRQRSHNVIEGDYDPLFEGVRAGIWQVATNATDMPCSDFYDSIQKGVAEAIKVGYWPERENDA